jgi:uncharacterized repeat protein (TIGR03803 family)
MKNAEQHRGWNLRIRLLTASAALALVVVILAQSVQAQTFRVLYAFKGETDGEYPTEGLIRDTAGNLYGTTPNGGHPGCGEFGLSCGVVFELDAAGNETVLYSFTGKPDGGFPYAGVVRDAAGNLYGTTAIGGCCGTVFKLDTAGKKTVLYRFKGGKDGSRPSSPLVRDTAGNLYGTTLAGGASSWGIVFKLDTSGKETVLHSFTGEKDGGEPGGLIRDAKGNLYGTTDFGGSGPGAGNGVVFKLDPTDKETVLHSFTGTDGSAPSGRLVRDGAGNLYGTTYVGGASGNGVVFKLDKTNKERVLYSFTGKRDGALPGAGLVRDSEGNLYGTTSEGGDSFSGTVFKLDTSGKETVLHSFSGADGSLPLADLVRDTAGNLYGTTQGGGSDNRGVVFMLTP